MELGDYRPKPNGYAVATVAAALIRTTFNVDDAVCSLRDAEIDLRGGGFDTAADTAAFLCQALERFGQQETPD